MIGVRDGSYSSSHRAPCAHVGEFVRAQLPECPSAARQGLTIGKLNIIRGACRRCGSAARDASPGGYICS